MKISDSTTTYTVEEIIAALQTMQDERQREALMYLIFGVLAKLYPLHGYLCPLFVIICRLNPVHGLCYVKAPNSFETDVNARKRVGLTIY